MQTYIISLGGSLIAPSKECRINHAFLKNFKEVIESHIKKDRRFFIITGGGSTARMYQNEAELLGFGNGELDWIGIHATRLNAQLLKLVFGDLVYPHIITNPYYSYKIQPHHKVILAGGWHPGNSTDYVASILADRYNGKHVINLSNIDYAYDKDPNKYKDAKKITHINWSDFRSIVGDTWEPGMSAPFDPIASKLAEKLGLRVSILNGDNLENLDKCIENQDFKGTKIG
jgi:uridylate kinase